MTARKSDFDGDTQQAIERKAMMACQLFTVTIDATNKADGGLKVIIPCS